MSQLHKEYSVGLLCSQFGKTRQAYYKQINQTRKGMINKDLIITFTKNIRNKQPKMGGRKLFFCLKSQFGSKITIGRDQYFALLRQHDLLLKRERLKVKTTDSYHRFHKYPNLIKTL